jgi:hypothetical protein
MKWALYAGWSAKLQLCIASAKLKFCTPLNHSKIKVTKFLPIYQEKSQKNSIETALELLSAFL